MKNNVFITIMKVLSGATIVGSFGLMVYGWKLERDAKKALERIDLLVECDDSSDFSEEDIDDSEKEEG